MKSRFTSILIILAIGLLWMAPTALAKEGSDQAAYGAENWSAGDLPPQGYYFLDYFGVYTGELKNGSGKTVVLPNGKNVTVNAEFDAFRFVEVTPWKFLGADYVVHAIIPVVHQDVNMGGIATKSTGLGNIDLDPIILSWHQKTFHEAVGLDIFMPTGQYNVAFPSIGTHYYTFQPILAVSYKPKSKWEASSKFMFDLNRTNTATNYHSGDDFHFDYGIGKHISSWTVGGTGYFLEQLADDTVGGKVVPGEDGVFSTGRRGQVFSVGPNIAYSTKNHMTFMAYYEREMAVRNRFEGNMYWVRAIIPLEDVFPRTK